jgi:hypothetical protein
LVSFKNTFKLFILLVIAVTFFTSCDDELTEQDINVRIVNETDCMLHIYVWDEHQMTLSPYTGQNISSISEGQKHFEAKRDGDLLVIQDTYVELHAGDEFTWVVNQSCQPLEQNQN